MLRKLLTLLAICAGLVAVSEPARAAVSPVESVRLVESARLACTTSPIGAQDNARLPNGRVQEKSKPCPKPTVVLIVPTVMLKVDRSRE